MFLSSPNLLCADTSKSQGFSILFPDVIVETYSRWQFSSHLFFPVFRVAGSLARWANVYTLPATPPLLSLHCLRTYFP